MQIPAYITWRPGVGDPDVIGWLTTVSYALASGVCWWAAQTARKWNPYHPEKRFTWLALGGLLLLLGINKQLDFQTLLIQVSRHFARRFQFFAYRRAIEEAVAVLLAGGGFVAVVFLKQASHFSARLQNLSVLGLVLLVLYVAIRAWQATGHEQSLQPDIIGFHWYSVLELGGIACLGAAGFWYGRTGDNGESPADR